MKHRFRRRVAFLVCSGLLCLTSTQAQDAAAGVSIPVTVTGEALASHRMQTDRPEASNVAGAFRVVLNPSIKLTEHWFAYSSIQLSSTPFFYYDAFSSNHHLEHQVLQTFLGYSRPTKHGTFLVKAGKLTSAFGSFPPRYDDADNPLIDQPLSYQSLLKLRTDQLPCGVADILQLRQYHAQPEFHCGGAVGRSEGIAPTTLYGLPGIEFDAAIHRFDARFQVTNSSPANPQSLLSGNQYLQWAAGAGYSIVQGLRAGVSGFRGSYLDRELRARSSPASGIGVDMQWARGRSSVNAEWQRFVFTYPGFRISPAIWSGYAEWKVILNPRMFVAARLGTQIYGPIEAGLERSSAGFAGNLGIYEVATGYRLNRQQLLKVGYEWLKTDGVSGTHDNVLGLQFVTTLQAFSKALR